MLDTEWAAGKREAVRLHKSGELAKAAEAYLDLLATRPDDELMGNLGLALRALGRTAEAERWLREAAASAPGRAEHWHNLGNLFWRLARLPEAAEAFEAALRLREDYPEARENLGNVYLAMGQEERGWRLYQARPELRRSQAQKLSFPQWRGEPLAGKRLFVWAEQGFGDEIFAARYLTQTGAAHVTVATRPELVRLFSQLPLEVLAQGDRVRVTPHDYWSLPLSLPQWARPAQTPYLAARPKPTGRIGIMWRGRDRPDPGRSLPADQAARLLALPGSISLQPEDTGAADFQATAEIIAGLELVVTVDTSVAHLAGALGRPGIVLLQHQAWDWRWREGDPGRSFHYPSLRMFRQPRPGEWPPVVDRVVAELS